MKRSIIVITSALALLVILVGVVVASGPAASSSVRWLSDFSEVPGSSASLVSNPNGATTALQTSDLPAGTYTTWWLIWNNPDACQNPNPILVGTQCTLADKGNSEVGFSVVYGTGHVVGSNGVGNFGSYLKKDDLTKVRSGAGLTNPMGAEIHVVVRYHGELEAGIVPEEIHTFGGGCPCANIQAAPFAQN